MPRGEASKLNAYKKPEHAMKTLWRLLGYFENCRAVVVFAILSVIIYAGVTVGASYVMKPFIRLLEVSGITPDEAHAKCMALLVLLGGLYLMGAVSNYLLNRLMLQCSCVILEALRNDMFCAMQDMPVSFFDKNTHGELMSYYTNDIDAVRELVESALTQMMISSISLVGIIAMMLILSPKLFLVMLLLAAVVTVMVRAVSSRSRKNYKKQQQAVASVNGYIEEMITGQRDVKVFCHEEKVMENFEPLNEELRQRATTANTLASIMGPMMNNTSHFFYALTTVIGVLWLTGDSVASLLIAFLQYIRQFADRVSQISQMFNNIMLALAGAERVFSVIDGKPEPDEGTVRLVNLDENGAECDRRTNRWGWRKENGELVPLRGDVRLRNVTFSYGRRDVLKDVSLYAKPGQKIALVGSTGAGKTTITNLINRFYEIYQGSITYDGIPIQEIKKDDLRRSLGMVLQDTHLFTGTVMENIRYGRPEATDEECIEAAKIANAHYFVSHLPEGYDTMLVSDGSNLSQGQRQLIAIARAAVSDPPVLILDEATSSIDTRTEKLIEKGMDSLMEGRTVFVIAHRLSTVRNANAIMVLEDGQIIERGDHDDLIAQHGKYYQLYTGLFELD